MEINSLNNSLNEACSVCASTAPASSASVAAAVTSSAEKPAVPTADPLRMKIWLIRNGNGDKYWNEASRLPAPSDSNVNLDSSSSASETKDLAKLPDKRFEISGGPRRSVECNVAALQTKNLAKLPDKRPEISGDTQVAPKAFRECTWCRRRVGQGAETWFCEACNGSGHVRCFDRHLNLDGTCPQPADPEPPERPSPERQSMASISFAPTGKASSATGNWRSLLKQCCTIIGPVLQNLQVQEWKVEFYEEEPDSTPRFAKDRPRLDILMIFTDGTWLRWYPDADLICSTTPQRIAAMIIHMKRPTQ